MSVLGGSATEATISGLMPSTNYSIQVAAANNAGTGPYSNSVSGDTGGMKFAYVLVANSLYAFNSCDNCIS